MIDEKNIRLNSVKAWLLAARPKTLAAAAVPVMLATAMAWHDSGTDIRVPAVILCFLFAFVMQVDANFVNDYFDFKRGNDDETRLGPKRACAQGWVTERAMLVALGITTGLGCTVGLPLIYYGGVEMILVGFACVVFCFLYTTHLSYLGLGDVLVLAFFGIVPVCCTYYVEVPDGLPRFGWHVLSVSIACGLVVDTLLIINNFRDIDNDIKAGKKTLAVYVGPKAMSFIYALVYPAGLLIVLLDFYSRLTYLVCVILLLLHYMTWKRMVRIGKGRELNKVLGMTARNIFLFGLLISLSVILS